jgi:hypothetical protein
MEYYKKIYVNGDGYPLEVCIIGGGVPAGTVPANVGQFYADSSDGYAVYVCTSKSSSGQTNWKLVVPKIASATITRIVNNLS